MRKGILIVDDIGKTKIELSTYLKKYNVEIIHCKDEIEALNKLNDAANNIKLIFWCVYADKSYEFDTIKKFKNTNFCKDVAIAIISVYNEKKYVFKAIEAGAVEYIIRPFNEDLIVRKVNEIIGLTSITNTTNSSVQLEDDYEDDDKIVLSLKDMLSINIKNASRGKYALSVLMISLMNVTDRQSVDTRGIVNTIIKALRTKLRENDIIIKYGMDNIIVILPFADVSGIGIVHEKLKIMLSDNSFLKEKAKGHILSSSFVTYPEDGKHQEHLLSRLQSKLQPILVFIDEDNL